jgi:hypothetical protein
VPTELSTRRYGAGGQAVAPPAAASPTVAASCRRLRFVVTLGSSAATRERRHAAVAEYLDGWLPLRVMAEQAEGKQCWVWVEIARPVEASTVADYVKGCPHCVAGTFKVLG